MRAGIWGAAMSVGGTSARVREVSCARAYAAALLASTVLAGSVQAQVAIWDGSAGDGNWLTGANWSTGAAPTAGETTLFNGATPRTIGLSAGGVVQVDAMQF